MTYKHPECCISAAHCLLWTLVWRLLDSLQQKACPRCVQGLCKWIMARHVHTDHYHRTLADSHALTAPLQAGTLYLPYEGSEVGRECHQTPKHACSVLTGREANGR
jgi:hypothetical protein